MFSSERNRLKELETQKIKGTGFITLIYRAGSNISDLNSMLTQEYSAASNIKNRVNRHAVLDALTHIRVAVKQMKQLPSQGIAFFAGQYV